MKKAVLLAGMVFLSWIVGCIPSLHPIYTDGDVIFDDALVGVWRGVTTDDTWSFSRSTPRAYRLLYTGKDGTTGDFQVHLAKIQGRLFLDLYPEEPELDANGFYKLHLIRAHTFILLEKRPSGLRMRVMDYRWLKPFLKQHPDAIQHEHIGNSFTFTASSKELQQFFLKHLDTAGAFSDPFELQRN